MESIMITSEQINEICSTDENAFNFMKELGIFMKFEDCRCPKCGSQLKLYRTSRYLDGYYYHCNKKISLRKQKKKVCDTKCSVRKHTFLCKSKLSIQQFLLFLLNWTKFNELRICQIAANISKHTALNFNILCSEVAAYHMSQLSEPIGGDGITVEINESNFGKRKYLHQHAVSEDSVFGGIEIGSGRMFLVSLDKSDSVNIIQLFKKWILPGTLIITDDSNTYPFLIELGYKHQTLNHSVKEINPLNSIESNSLPQYGRKKKWFWTYLSRYLFLRKCQHDGIDPVREFCKVAAQMYNPLQPNTSNIFLEDNEYDDDRDFIDLLEGEIFI